MLGQLHMYMCTVTDDRYYYSQVTEGLEITALKYLFVGNTQIIEILKSVLKDIQVDINRFCNQTLIRKGGERTTY